MATRAERRDELLTKAATYRRTAVEVHDASLSSAYVQMAREAEKKAEALWPRPSGAPVTRRTIWKRTRGANR